MHPPCNHGLCRLACERGRGVSRAGYHRLLGPAGCYGSMRLRSVHARSRSALQEPTHLSLLAGRAISQERVGSAPVRTRIARSPRSTPTASLQPVCPVSPPLKGSPPAFEALRGAGRLPYRSILGVQGAPRRRMRAVGRPTPPCARSSCRRTRPSQGRTPTRPRRSPDYEPPGCPVAEAAAAQGRALAHPLARRPLAVHPHPRPRDPLPTRRDHRPRPALRAAKIGDPCA